MTSYKMSDVGIDVLIELEGSIDHLYYDVAGYATIGVGHLLTKSEISSGKIILSNGYVIDFRYGNLTQEDITLLLKDDVVMYENAVNKYVKVNITQEHFDSLTSFTFNVGIGAFKRSTLLKVLNRKEYSKVPAQLARWKRAGGKVVKGLVYRRGVEISMWNTKRPDIDYTVYA